MQSGDETLPGDPAREPAETPAGSADDTLAADAETQAPARPIRRPTALSGGGKIGRYVIIEELGAGAMGVVWAGFDPKLERRVAIKLVKAGGLDAQSRLLREAQALAKLSHPNVVGVHDTGTYGDDVWVAMEYVDGRTLTDWLREPRAWREVAAHMVAAGEGLVAAHEAGIVHRDFKPDNVMLGRDGRVRVMDLGLARPIESEPRDTIQSGGSALAVTGDSPAIDDPDATLPSDFHTRAGAIMGTPAYMPPEQFEGSDVDERADQFSYCVAFWEALYGQRPFLGGNTMALMAAIVDGRKTPPPRRTAPRWLHRVLERGLATDPARRYPSMRALLSAVRTGRRRVRVVRASAVALVIAATGAGIAGWDAVERGRRVEACAARAAEIDEVWGSEDSRDRLQSRVLSTDSAFARSTWARVEASLDEYAAAWSVARRSACEAASVARTRPAALDRRAEACLWGLEERLRATVQAMLELEDQDAFLRRAAQAFTGLPRPEQCDDDRFLAHVPDAPSDATTREQVTALHLELFRAEAVGRAGDWQRALVLVEGVLEREAEIDWPFLKAEALGHAADQAQNLGDLARAHRDNVEALRILGALGDDREAASTATVLVYTTTELGRYEEADAWVEMARILGDRAQALESWDIGAGLEAHLGVLAMKRDDFDGAEAHMRRSIELRRAGPAQQSTLIANGHHNLGLVLVKKGEYDEAEEELERALKIHRAVLGELHPELALNLYALASLANDRGDYARSDALLQQAIALLEEVADEDSPRLALFRSARGSLLLAQGEYGRAQEVFREILATQERVLGPQHPDVADTLANLGATHYQLDEIEAAERVYRRALAIREEVLPPGSFAIADALNRVADVLHEQGRHDEAGRLYERALSIGEQAVGPDHADLVFSLTGVALVARAQGHLRRAEAAARRGVELRVAGQQPPEYIAEIRALWSAILWDLGERERSLAEARTALDEYGQVAEIRKQAIAELEAWIAERTPASGG